METYSNMNWEISFIFTKSSFFHNQFLYFLEKKYNLKMGDNDISFFGNRKIIVFLVQLFEEDVTDFDELCISFSEQSFRKETFNSELESFTKFVNHCFKLNSFLNYAFCSFELNGYLISQVQKMDDFDNEEYLNKFPVLYKRIDSSPYPRVIINYKSQDIFGSI